MASRQRPGWGAELACEALACADALHNLARYLTRNESDAADLVQETYARALAAADQFTPGTNVKAWLVRILRNTFISAHRRQRRSPTCGGLDTIDPLVNGSLEADWRPDDGRLDQWRHLLAEELEAAVMSLSEDSRTVVLLHAEGFTEAEVAAAMGCAVGTVKSRLCRARIALRRRLQDYAR